MLCDTIIKQQDNNEYLVLTLGSILESLSQEVLPKYPRILGPRLSVAVGVAAAEVDCHSSVISSLKRLLVRHKLRQPLTIDDVSAGAKRQF